MSIKAFAIHGHFYQPPREDPLSGEVPQEPGAMPYRNWNERIHDHCYRPNALLGNFERISFNMGPTLMDWMEGIDPRTLAKIIEQDAWNQVRNGVGNAMAQPYNHTILPLASREDKITQVRWGIADFRHHFGRQPDGMWLPETAVDLETLQILAEHQIKFTILAPWQADGELDDNVQPHFVSLSQGQKIAVFFYNQDLSTRISFDPAATVNADQFLCQYLHPKYNANSNGVPQLILVASDGELYGHHQPFRDKFLSYLLSGAMALNPIETTYPALWLKQHPPIHEVKIKANTSWSCQHGMIRWKGVCGCTPHGEWKAPLRLALEEIAHALDEEYLKYVDELVDDPWELRNDYIHVVLEEINLEELFVKHTKRLPDGDGMARLRLLMGAQYERQRMFTSCGWFFEDFDRIEPRNSVSYTAQAVWLTNLATGSDLSTPATGLLRSVRSWRTGTRADSVFNHHLQRARSSHIIGKIRA